ncbi:zinc finger CCHC domain-containing protein 7 [Pagrus major]|uniref:zinc finger CCHC domain-containing protein 7 n=1 Tax=Pagrus major TaxID=143350 RepID=UPI003CC89D64
MYCSYQDREEFEDDLYQEGDGDSDESEANSELEFHLYSQLHYSSNAGETEEQVDRGEEVVGQDVQQPKVSEKSADVDGEQEHNGESRPRSLEICKLLQNLKKKEEREEKRGKRTRKDQRSSSSFFEEVIVIDSSPNVISISDDTADDDEGVCALKGQGLQRGQTSTPAQQGTQKRKRSLGKPVIVDLSSSESDSDSDSLSDSSDSEDLENWMILGRGNQDGDQSISLNLEGEETISLHLEGGFDSYADVKEKRGSSWLVSAKDKEARIYNKDKGARVAVQRLSNRYYTDKSVQCRNCNKLGHLSKNCPEPKKLSPCFLCGTPGHLVSQCPNRHCSNCGQPGHLYESCSEKAYWHKQCHRCGMTGHFFDACPEIWRQYHITTKKVSKKGIPVKKKGGDRGRAPAYCYNCSRKGHYGHACTRQRMFNGTYPTTPFINHYDTAEDIKRRQHRIGLKVQELQKNGIFLAGPLTPRTPGPPKKKQKINHKSNHTPHKSPNNHKPSPSHIFFSDKHDFMAPTPKTNKSKKHKQQESSSNVKPWKPKRPVPTSRNPPSKLILDEADDFPRGGGKAASLDIKKKKKRKPKQAPSAAPEGHKGSKADRRSWTGEMHGSESKPDKAKRKRGYKNKRFAEKKAAAQTHPTDENLFNIKQRKRSR